MNYNTIVKYLFLFQVIESIETTSVLFQGILCSQFFKKNS